MVTEEQQPRSWLSVESFLTGNAHCLAAENCLQPHLLKYRISLRHTEMSLHTYF